MPELLRDVRRRRGLSVRAAAERCDVPRATWAGWESGATTPTARRLDEALRALGFDLALSARGAEPPGELRVRRFLTRSLTSRARAALGEQLDVVLEACRTGPRRITGPAEVGVWVPHVVARGRLPLPPVQDDPALVGIRIDLTGDYEGRWVAVATPAVLLSAGRGELWPALRTSARLLAQEAPRDAAERRLPPHRDPDEKREIRDLLHTLTYGARSFFPVSDTDSRAWRLDAPATLDELLERKGLPPRHRRPDAWRHAG